MRLDRVGDGTGEQFPVDGERRAGRNAVRIGGAHDERAEPPHFFFEQAYRVIELVATQRIRADELRELIGLVHRSRAHRAHLVQRRAHAEGRSLPRGLATCETPADDVNHDLWAG